MARGDETIKELKLIFKICVYIILLSPVFLIGKGIYQGQVNKKKVDALCAQTGIFVFERVALDESMLMPVPDDWGTLKKEFAGRPVPQELVLEDDKMLNVSNIKKVYEFNYKNLGYIENMPTWKHMRAEIIRKSDGKLMGYTYAAQGFSSLKRHGLVGGMGNVTYPKYKGHAYNSLSFELAKKIFYIENGAK